jgi:hypothetical protein
MVTFLKPPTRFFGFFNKSPLHLGEMLDFPTPTISRTPSSTLGHLQGSKIAIASSKGKGKKLIQILYISLTFVGH